MRSRDALEPPEALVLTMVLVAAADGGITDREIGVMSGQVQTLPIFQDFATTQFINVTDAAVDLLNEEDGLRHAGRLIRAALDNRLRETADAWRAKSSPAIRPRSRGRSTCSSSCATSCIWIR